MGEVGRAAPGGGAAAPVTMYLCALVRSRRDLEIERPVPGAHTVTLQ